MLIPWKLLSENSEDAGTMLERLLEVAAADPLIFDEVMRGILHADDSIRIQATGMVEKITRVRPLFLMPYRRVLLKEIAAIELVKVRQQLALLYGRVRWDEWDMKQVVALLGTWIETEQDEHLIMNAIQSLHTLAMQKEWIHPILLQHLGFAMKHTSLAVRNFAEKVQT